MNPRHAMLAIVSATALLTGCGSSGKASDWAADACKTFPSAAAAKVTGLAITKAEAPGSTGNEQTAVSNCTYSTADGKTNFGVLLRQDKTGQTTVAEQIAGLTAQPAMTGPSEEVKMPKGKAIWAPKLNTLSWIPDDARMIVVTPPGAITFGKSAPAGDLKAKAIAIATAVEG